MDKVGFVYILTNKNHTVLYVGSTDDLRNGCREHSRKKYAGSFTARYNVISSFIGSCFPQWKKQDEKKSESKVESRQKKIDLVNSMNPGWNDLRDEKLNSYRG